jgi:AraC-like DNA-binding protein
VGLQYQEFAPSAPLQPFVECLWSVKTGESVPAYVVPPDGCVDIVYSERGGLVAVGTMTTQQTLTLPAGEEVVGIRFHPGLGRNFLRVPPGKLTDLLVPLEDVWGRAGRELTRKLEDAASITERVALLAGMARATQTQVTALHQAIGAMVVAAQGEADLESVASQANLSPRQFRRRCQEESGLTPKHLCRVLRFRRALRLLDNGTSWSAADLAAECGYYDQAHFIHDFREFQGCTPGEYAAVRRTRLQP